MTPIGPRNERETIIRFSDEDSTVSIWTASGKVYQKCLKAGFQLVDHGERHASFRCSLKNLTLRKARSPLSPADKAKIANRFKKVAK